jgi:hypothetical protein
MRTYAGLIMVAGLLVAGCGGGSDSAEPTTTPTPTSATPSASPSPTAPAVAQGFPEGSRYWTFADGPNVWAAYTEVTGNQLCLIRLYPEYKLDRGVLTEIPAGQQLDMGEAPATMVSSGQPAYTATVTGAADVAVTVTAPFGVEVFTPTDVAGAAAAIEASLPTADGIMAATEIPAACSEPGNPTLPGVGSTSGFNDGLQFWTTDGGTIGAFSRRNGNAMCLVVLYPESRPDVGTVSDNGAGQDFAIEAKDGGVLFEPEPAQTAIVSGDSTTGLTLNYTLTGFVRSLAPADPATVGALLEIMFPFGESGEAMLNRNLAACP